MNNKHTATQEEIICQCSGTKRAKVEQLIARGVNTIEKIAIMTGATTGCGACDYLVLELIAQSTRDVARN
jgi:NAD(P)H-nitrite reductase large subunit